MNQVICGYRVDVIFPARTADREQDGSILAQTGIPTIRVTHKQFHGHPAAQAARIHAVLAARRGRGRRAA